MVRPRRVLYDRLFLGSFFALVIAALAGEVWLQAEARASEHAAQAALQGNPFFGVLAGRGSRSIWKHRFVEYRPNARFEAQVGDARWVVETNGVGFRTPEFDPCKPAGTIRIACIGASTTFQGTTNERTYPAVLERRLREIFPDARIEVLNLGISATLSDHWLERRRLAQLFAYDPDVVIQLNAVNDIGRLHVPAWFQAHPSRARLYRSRLAQWLFPPDPRDFDASFAATLANFARMAAECESRGVTYVVGSFAAPERARAPRATRQLLDAYMAAYIPNHPVRYFAMYAALLARYNLRFASFVRERQIRSAEVHREVTDPALFTDICHMTDAGIERLAEAFLPAAAAAVEAGGAHPPR